MTHKIPECIPSLLRLGISQEHAYMLRRISMHLHRWHELECGVENGGVERDETTGKTYWYSSHSGKRWSYPDRETAALARLAKLMSHYPMLSYHVQGDPRGCALWILCVGDVPPGESVDAYYSRGLPVYK